MASKTFREAALNFTFAIFILAGSPVGALAQGQTKYEEFTAKVANIGVGAGQDLKMDVFRWSTDEERTALLAALKEKEAAEGSALAEAIQKGPSLGTIWTSESLGYTIRYAYREALPNGTERVVLVTDRRFGSWSGQVWKPLKQAESVDYPFSLVELRLKQNGAGEGKMSLTTKVAVDESGKTLALAGYDAAPIVLRNAKREPGPSK
jgi:hypothetical protein